eukprot:5368563-Amphidinium_carterae.1
MPTKYAKIKLDDLVVLNARFCLSILQLGASKIQTCNTEKGRSSAPSHVKNDQESKRAYTIQRLI